MYRPVFVIQKERERYIKKVELSLSFLDIDNVERLLEEGRFVVERASDSLTCVRAGLSVILDTLRVYVVEC